MSPLPNHCIECDKPTMDTICDKCKEKDMGKVKEKLIENMIRYPELYNGEADYDFWMQCRKEELLEREGMDSKPHKQKGKKDGKISTR